MTTKPSIIKAAKAFYTRLNPSEVFDYTDDPAKALIVAAFALYANEWHSATSHFRISQWEWPAEELASGAKFEGDQPWTVLFRRAVELTA